MSNVLTVDSGDIQKTTWSKFFGGMLTDPTKHFGEYAEMIWHNFLHNWWQFGLIIFAFWIARLIVYSIIDVFVPRSLSDRPPRWARSKVFVSLRGKVYKQSLQSRSFYRTKAVVGLIKSFIDPVMFFVAFTVLFGKLGFRFENSTVTVIIGAFSLAIAFGAQGVIKDILSGITVLVTDAYAVGDYIDVQFGASGIVRKIGLRLTELEASDGTIWFIRHSEIPKIGNRTAARGMVVTDVTLTWNDEDHNISLDDLKYAEKTLDHTIRGVAETLEDVDKISRAKLNGNEKIDVEDIVSIVPDLVPTMSAERMWNLKEEANKFDSDDTGFHRIVKTIPGRVPVFTKVETLGLVNSTKNSVTLRLRITLPPNASRSQGMAVLRRVVFEAFVDDHITPQFEDAPEGSLIYSAIESK